MAAPQSRSPDRAPRQQILRRLLVVDGIIFIAVAVVCLLAEHLRSWVGYGNGLILAGAVIVGFAVFSLAGGLNTARTFGYQMAESAGPEGLYKRGQRQADTVSEAMRTLLQAVVLALPPLVVGVLLRILFNPPTA